MTLATLISEINYNLKGVDDDAPVLGDDDWNHWVVIINKKKNQMYDDVGKNWASAFAIRTIGVVAAGSTPAFNLNLSNSDYIAPADQAYVVKTDGNKVYFDVVKPQDRSVTVQQLYVYSQNPAIIQFTLDIAAADPIVAGSLKLPGYWRPADVDGTSGSSYIPVDDPHWLAMAAAADIAFNDITYEDKFDDLNGQANVLYRQQARKNRRTGQASVSASRTQNAYRIRGFRR